MKKFIIRADSNFKWWLEDTIFNSTVQNILAITAQLDTGLSNKVNFNGYNYYYVHITLRHTKNPTNSFRETLNHNHIPPVQIRPILLAKTDTWICQVFTSLQFKDFLCKVTVTRLCCCRSHELTLKEGITGCELHDMRNLTYILSCSARIIVFSNSWDLHNWNYPQLNQWEEI